ncbi:hypothetical protein HELRODRAFT_113633 [Helobdella robusta]|uniref:Uncharacterized protein n=1 Tax=Helobdella robusta TaxID=6412 RepID=T1EFU5_HELRO|nr:hypothetical protein HELRODRAFT_113633 [Helobdella robusta]ESN99510.1 hypothetical protein HELRODRAFT_113633 [Helobdella robusta]
MSHSHEALLSTSSISHDFFDLSIPGLCVYPIHPSIVADKPCFVIRIPKLRQQQELQNDNAVAAESSSTALQQHQLYHHHHHNKRDSSSSRNQKLQSQQQQHVITTTLGEDSCMFVTSNAGYNFKYFRCDSEDSMHKWISRLRDCINACRNNTFRTDNCLSISIVESKNLLHKKRYYCKLYLDDVLYARTSSKQMLEHVFWGEQFQFSELADVQMISIHLFKEVEKKRKRDKSFLIGCITISADVIKNKPLSEKWYDVTSPSSSSSSSSSNKSRVKVEGVGVRVKGRYQSVDILPLVYYDSLLRFLQTDYTSLIELLEPVIGVKTKEGVATSLASTLHCSGNVVDFLCNIVMNEVDKLENNALALRGNSIATKAVESYMKLVGQKYLVATLRDVLQTVIESGVDCEVDNNKVANQTTLNTNRSNLTEKCTLVWNKIINSRPNFPRELKRLFHMIRECCQKKADGHRSMCHQIISSCIFLRFFCPAILSPSLFGIVQEFPCDRGVRNLTLIAKTIQNLANLT